MVPFVSNQQLCRLPAETAENEPVGGDDCPKVSSSQQARVLSVRTAQECRLPALTAVKVLGSGIDWPK